MRTSCPVCDRVLALLKNHELNSISVESLSNGFCAMAVLYEVVECRDVVLSSHTSVQATEAGDRMARA